MSKDMPLLRRPRRLAGLAVDALTADIEGCRLSHSGSPAHHKYSVFLCCAFPALQMRLSMAQANVNALLDAEATRQREHDALKVRHRC